MPKRMLESADALAVIAASTMVAGHQQGDFGWFWETEFAEQNTWLPLALLVTAAFFGAFQPFRRLAESRKLPLRHVWERHLLATLGDLVLMYRDAAVPNGLDFRPTDLGLHVWKVEWVVRPSWLPVGRELVRVKTMRLGAVPAIRYMRFTKGKGVVGLCWKRNDEVVVDVFSDWKDVDTLDEWARLPAEKRQGLSYDESVRVRDRGAILASPIRRSAGTRFIGCVSVDLFQGASFLTEERVRNRVQQLCIGLGGSYFEGLD